MGIVRIARADFQPLEEAFAEEDIAAQVGAVLAQADADLLFAMLFLAVFVAGAIGCAYAPTLPQLRAEATAARGAGRDAMRSGGRWSRAPVEARTVSSGGVIKTSLVY